MQTIVSDNKVTFYPESSDFSEAYLAGEVAVLQGEDSDMKKVEKEIIVQFSKKTVAQCSAILANKLLELGNPEGRTAFRFAEALARAPIPMTSGYGVHPLPSLEDSELESIEEELKQISLDYLISYDTKEIQVNTDYVLVVTMDARDMTVSLEKIEDEVEITRDTSFCVSNTFRFEDEDALDGAGGSDFVGTTQVFANLTMVKSDEYIKARESFITRVIYMRGISYREHIHLYKVLAKLYFPEISIERLYGVGFPNIIFGVSPSRKSMMAVIVKQGMLKKFRPGSIIIEGEAEIHYLVGDIQHPFSCALGGRIPVFDVCEDEPRYTTSGPTLPEFVMLEEGFTNEYITSWASRSSATLISGTKQDFNLEDLSNG